MRCFKMVFALTVLLLSTMRSDAQVSGITGRVTDERGLSALAAIVTVTDSTGTVKDVTTTTFGGHFEISPLQEGCYTLDVLYLGILSLTSVEVFSGKLTSMSTVEIDLTNFYKRLCSPFAGSPELINPKAPGSDKTHTAKQISHL